MRHLFTTTAIGLVLAITPAFAQTNQAPAQPEVQQQAPESTAPATPPGSQPRSGAPDANPSGDAAQTPNAGPAKQAASTEGERASELIGLTVANARGETVGEINDLIVASDGSVTSVLIGIGGFLGLGGKNVAVNYADLNVRVGNDGLTVTIAMSKEELEALPAYKSEGDSTGAPESSGEKPMKRQDRAPEGDAAPQPKTKL